MNKNLIWNRFVEGVAGGYPELEQGADPVLKQCLVLFESRDSKGHPTGGYEIRPVQLHWMNHALTAAQQAERADWDDDNGNGMNCWVSEHCDWALYNEEGDPFLFTGWVSASTRYDYEDYYTESALKVIAWRDAVIYDPSHEPYATLNKDGPVFEFKSNSRNRISEAFADEMLQIVRETAQMFNSPSAALQVAEARTLVGNMLHEAEKLDNILMDAMMAHKAEISK
ncbi:hypothetical protein [Providencia phage Kokobel2]|nr:hypothetical protein [Providencia phage Kokobel2]